MLCNETQKDTLFIQNIHKYEFENNSVKTDVKIPASDTSENAHICGKSSCKPTPDSSICCPACDLTGAVCPAALTQRATSG
jgi:hypothetical protein